MSGVRSAPTEGAPSVGAVAGCLFQIPLLDVGLAGAELEDRLHGTDHDQVADVGFAVLNDHRPSPALGVERQHRDLVVPGGLLLDLVRDVDQQRCVERASLSGSGLAGGLDAGGGEQLEDPGIIVGAHR
jgi:hypothetical protein